MLGRDFKDAFFVELAATASAFGSPKRLELLDLLAQGERSVETLAAQAALSVANTSRHLQILKTARLVGSRKEGQRVLYRLADSRVFESYRDLRELAQSRGAEIGRLAGLYFSSVDGLEPIGKEELLRRLRRRDALILDVRPAEEYAAGHIAGARSFPLAELSKRLAELPRARQVVAYCRGPFCVLAAEAVRLLRAHGVQARRFAEGFPEWRDAGLPIVTGAEPPRRIEGRTR
jgi:rhodanese-related sulfurtransferase